MTRTSVERRERRTGRGRKRERRERDREFRGDRGSMIEGADMLGKKWSINPSKEEQMLSDPGSGKRTPQPSLDSKNTLTGMNI